MIRVKNIGRTGFTVAQSHLLPGEELQLPDEVLSRPGVRAEIDRLESARSIKVLAGPWLQPATEVTDSDKITDSDIEENEDGDE